jgi:hypothetical protein
MYFYNRRVADGSIRGSRGASVPWHQRQQLTGPLAEKPKRLAGHHKTPSTLPAMPQSTINRGTTVSEFPVGFMLSAGFLVAVFVDWAIREAKQTGVEPTKTPLRKKLVYGARSKLKQRP